MIRLGTVTGSELKVNKDGLTVVRMLQVQLAEAEDIQDVQLITQVGNESFPEIGSQVIVISINRSFKVAIASDDLIVPSMNTGEKKLYSTAGGVIMAFINILNSGIIEINGNTDFAVRFNPLNIEFEKLRTEVNAALTILNAHVHTLAGVGTTDPMATPTVLATAEISAAKVNEVKLP